MTEEQGGEVPLVGVSALKRMNWRIYARRSYCRRSFWSCAEPDGAAEGLVLEATTQKGLGVVTPSRAARPAVIGRLSVTVRAMARCVR